MSLLHLLAISHCSQSTARNSLLTTHPPHGSRSPALHRRRVQRQPGARRLGLRLAALRHRQGIGAVRGRAGNDQQPHGADRGDPRPGRPEAAHPRRAGHRQRLRGQGPLRVAPQVEGPRLAPPRGKAGWSRSRTKTSGASSTHCWPSTRSASTTSAATPATPKTSAATRWPWRRIRSTCARGEGGRESFPSRLTAILVPRVDRRRAGDLAPNEALKKRKAAWNTRGQ